MFFVKLNNDDVYLRILFCSILSGFLLSFVLLFFISQHLFAFLNIIIYGVIFSLIYLVTGAPIQYFLNKRPNKGRASSLFIYLIIGTIVNTIFFIIVSDIDKLYLDIKFYFMIFSASIIFWLNDLFFLRSKK